MRRALSIVFRMYAPQQTAGIWSSYRQTRRQIQWIKYLSTDEDFTRPRQHGYGPNQQDATHCNPNLTPGR